MNEKIIIALTIYAVIITAGFVLYYIIHKRQHNKKFYEYQDKILKLQIEEMNDIYMTIRGWRHDYHNHMQTIKAHMDAGQLDEALAYVDKMDGELDKIDFEYKSGNVGVDAILNSKLSLAKKHGIRLSGGEQQKLMLAKCIYKNAPFLILDEPTAALDPLAESAMYEEYNKLTKDKTSLFISHRLASTRFCDRILFLENGQIAEMGTHEELMKMGGRYAKIYEVQSHYYREDGKEEDMEAAYES